jgi:hypothetical protein
MGRQTFAVCTARAAKVRLLYSIRAESASMWRVGAKNRVVLHPAGLKNSVACGQMNIIICVPR